jgi:hypothetical protein
MLEERGKKTTLTALVLAEAAWMVPVVTSSVTS